MTDNIPKCLQFVRDTLRNEAIYSDEHRKALLYKAIGILKKVEEKLDTNDKIL